MKMRILSVFAAVALLAACESAPEGGASTGTGGQGGASTATGTAKAIPAPAAGTLAEFQASAGDRVFFDYDKSSVRADAGAILKKQAEWLKKYPGVTAIVEGHCDERGTREYNLALGNRRAAAVRDALVAKGVDAKRLKIVSYGKEKPASVGSNESAWSQNRRGVTTISVN